MVWELNCLSPQIAGISAAQGIREFIEGLRITARELGISGLLCEDLAEKAYSLVTGTSWIGWNHVDFET